MGYRWYQDNDPSRRRGASYDVPYVNTHSAIALISFSIQLANLNQIAGRDLAMLSQMLQSFA